MSKITKDLNLVITKLNDMRLPAKNEKKVRFSPTPNVISAPSVNNFTTAQAREVPVQHFRKAYLAMMSYDIAQRKASFNKQAAKAKEERMAAMKQS